MSMTRIYGITRVRNEALIIADTLDHFLEYCSHIVLYDDASTDDTVALAREVGGDRITIIENDAWRLDRNPEETRHRRIACDAAVLMGADWILCFDADERLVGDLPELEADGYRFRLFDGYLTPRYPIEYAAGRLDHLPREWGPEYRDILMLFRACYARWNRPGLREPQFSGRVELADVFVKHFGKCLSVEQWDENCAYYQRGFPESFKRRWRERVGKAVHTVSDFGRPLFEWDELMEKTDQWTPI